MRPETLIERKKRDPLTKLNVVFDLSQSKGMPFDVNGTIRHFQCRPIDMTNWGNLVGNLARNRVALNAANRDITLMTEEDVPVTVTVDAAITIIETIQNYYNALYGARWACKEQFKLVTDVAQREAINVKATFDTILNLIINPE